MATQKSDPVTDTLSVIEDSEDDFANFDWTGAEVIHSPWADKVAMQSSLLVHEVPTPLPVDEVPTALPVEEPVPKRQRQLPTPPYHKHKKRPSQVSWNDLPPDEFKVPGWGGYWCEDDGWFIPTHCSCYVTKKEKKRDTRTDHYYKVHFPGGIPGDGRKTLHYNCDVYGRHEARKLAWRHVSKTPATFV